MSTTQTDPQKAAAQQQAKAKRKAELALETQKLIAAGAGKRSVKPAKNAEGQPVSAILKKPKGQLAPVKNQANSLSATRKRAQSTATPNPEASKKQRRQSRPPPPAAIDDEDAGPHSTPATVVTKLKSTGKTTNPTSSVSQRQQVHVSAESADDDEVDLDEDDDESSAEEEDWENLDVSGDESVSSEMLVQERPRIITRSTAQDESAHQDHP
ncbi:hypothetical protein FB45DRAFT_1069708 [Roridomyces roridus]|uniref:Uncharacterized protein n=1 Tax=Roridomyces roridus TaxID=1738132 RepID=A0AAD7AYY3_9AGAR|nr:hypothetical protein FB45DRAFT_1069708 [Roridomyces roridus]